MKRPAALAAVLALASCAPPPASAPAPPPPAPPPPGLTRLLGQRAEAVTALLGKPSLDRAEGKARQLQFIRGPCVLDVFLYPSAAGVQTVRTAAARRPDGSHIDAGACLSLIAPP